MENPAQFCVEINTPAFGCRRDNIPMWEDNSPTAVEVAMELRIYPRSCLRPSPHGRPSVPSVPGGPFGAGRPADPDAADRAARLGAHLGVGVPSGASPGSGWSGGGVGSRGRWKKRRSNWA